MINGVPRILIIRLSAIGDVVRVLPALQALRLQYPHAQIDWLVEPKSRDIVEGHPALDRCLVFARGGGWKENLRAFLDARAEIRQARYDVALDFHGGFKSGLLAWSTGARRRCGFARPRSKELNWLFVNERVRLPDPRMNRLDENSALARHAGAEHHDLDAPIAVPEETEEAISNYIEYRFHGGKPLVAVHAPVERAEKQWPLRHFASLCDLLLADGRYDVLLTWGPGQRPVAEEVQKLARRHPEIAPETPDLKHLAALLREAVLYVGGDTGPLHIAAAMGTPAVSIFGGTDPAKHAPLHTPGHVLYMGPPEPPRRFPLQLAEKNLAAVTPEMVYDACVRVLHAPAV